MKSIPNDVGPYASPACFLHELDSAYLGLAEEIPTAARARADRLVPGRSFPPYAYLPGRFPHPVRDARGHSYRAEPVSVSVDPDALRWGMDLFNYGFYWEAHEAWEELWRMAPKSTPLRDVLHGLILMAACGVKLREGKRDAAHRHGTRAASLFRLASSRGAEQNDASGIDLPSLAAKLELEVTSQARSVNDTIVFDFSLPS